MNETLSDPDKPHSKYTHVYAILRFDFEMSPENRATVAKILPTREEAELEAARLRAINEGKKCTYAVQTTRLVGAKIITEN